jgi:hypothetical protein
MGWPLVLFILYMNGILTHSRHLQYAEDPAVVATFPGSSLLIGYLEA